MSVETSILNAIDVIVDRALETASFDKTVRAFIIECVDQSIGKYKVKYQDSVYYATTENTSSKLSKGAEVYLLVPEGKFSNDKKILGTVKALGTDYVNTIEKDEGFELIGTNTFLNHKQAELCSYKDEEKVLYKKDDESKRDIEVNEEALQEYITQASHILLSAEIQTKLPQEQQNYGNYGIRINFTVLDDATKTKLSKDCIMDIDNFLGQPYKYSNFSKQLLAFEINGKNFVSLNEITVFVKDFPHKADDKPNDIFIKDIQLVAAVPLNEAALDDYYLSLITPKGTFFTTKHLDTDSLILETEVKAKGKVIDKSSHSLQFYWFIEHAGIDSKHPLFNVYGGQGWKCLNQYNVISGVKDEENNVFSPDRVEWVPGKDSFEIKKSDCLTKETKYKCVCLYNESTVLEKEIIIKNKDAKVEIKIESSNGTEFFYDQGVTSLECVFDKDENLSYNYYWSKKNNNGNYEALQETADLNTLYHKGESFELYLIAGFQNQSFFETAEYKTNSNYVEIENLLKERNKNLKTYKDYYNEIVSYLKDTTITRLEKGVLHNLQIKTITNFSNYSCSVFRIDGDNKETFIGNASIKITNTFEEKRGYSLVIHNGTQIFKYDEKGVSPTHESNLVPQVVPTLSFSLFDENGTLVEEEDVRRNCSVKWKIPKTDTMLSSNMTGEKYEEDNYIIYTNTLIFSYEIANSFYARKNLNNIELEVKYRNKILFAQTNLTFLKEGDSGTNGTDYICKIVLNSQDSILPQCPTLYYLPNGNCEMNYNIGGFTKDAKKYNQWLKVQLWKTGGQLIEEVAASDYTAEWSILKNKYTSKHSDSSSFSVSSNGVFSVGAFSEDHPANIVKVTVTLEDKKYFATMPINTVKIINNNYRATVKNNTGYNFVVYNSDGVQPKYDTDTPFEIEVLNGTTDISLSSKLKFQWSQLGRYYIGSPTKGSWYNENLFKIPNSITNSNKIQSVSQYDGLVVNGAIKIIVKYDNVDIAVIHKPVHFMLNKYGFSALNDWDGNSVELGDANGGMILSPQVGAGKKGNDNTFTGIIMGAVQDPNDTEEKVGLLGYSSGQRSIFLDAKSGKAEFGISNKGKIILDPSNNSAIIEAGNYNVTDKTGMQINLSDASITYGNGNFKVSSEGHITAEGGGKIAGWTIGDKRLTSGNTGMSSDNSNSSNLAFWAGSTFSVTHGGYLTATSGKIGGWALTAKNLTSASNEKDDDNNVIPDFTLSNVNFSRKINGTERKGLRMAIGNRFAVSYTGTLYSNKATIENATIDKATISNAKISSLKIGDNTLKPTTITLQYVSSASVSWTRTQSGVYGFLKLPTFTHITDANGVKAYAISSRSNLSMQWIEPINDIEVSINKSSKKITVFT